MFAYIFTFVLRRDYMVLLLYYLWSIQIKLHGSGKTTSLEMSSE